MLANRKSSGPSMSELAMKRLEEEERNELEIEAKPMKRKGNVLKKKQEPEEKLNGRLRRLDSKQNALPKKSESLKKGVLKWRELKPRDKQSLLLLKQSVSERLMLQEQKENSKQETQQRLQWLI